MLMSFCRLDIRKGILDDVNKELVANRYTFTRTSDDTIRINSQQDNAKSKAKSNAQAYEIANSILDRVKQLYYGHVSGYITETSPYDPITVTFVPSEAYITHELAKHTGEGDTTRSTFIKTDETSLPENPEDAVDLIIQLKSTATEDEVKVYGDGKYIIKTSEANKDLVGTKTKDNRTIKFEEILRIYPLDEYYKSEGARVHGLLIGQGVYKRLKDKFVVVGKVDNNKGLAFQLPGTEGSKASPKTITRVKEFMDRNKIDLKALDTTRYGGINGVANLTEDLIQIAEGKTDVALTEEAMHFAVDMIKQGNPVLYKQMLNKISSYRIYQDVINKYSQTYIGADGKPDIVKIKEEAMGKVLAEYLILETEGGLEKPELIAQALSWWEQIKQWVQNLLKIAGFNPFQEAAKSIDTLTGETGTGEFYQLSDAQKGIIDKINEVGDNIQKVYNPSAESEEDNNYYEKKLPDGTWKRVVYRVTDIAKHFKERIFGKNKKFTDAEKAFNEILRNAGIAGHLDVENIINRMVDNTTNLLKDTEDPRPERSNIDPTDASMKAYGMLETYVRDLLHSFPAGTRFLPEVIIFDDFYKKEGQAGTIDLLIIEPDGKANIYDWKFMGKNNQDDIASWKQGSYDLQIKRYKEILKDRYGVKAFGKTRAIPILMDFKTINLLNDKTRTYMDGIAVGTADPKKTEKIGLLPVPTYDEKTGIKEIDRVIDKLNAQYEKYKKEKPESDEEKELKRDILQTIRKTVRILQTQQNVTPLVDAAGIFNEYADTLFKQFDELRQFAPNDPSITDKDINELAFQLDEAIAISNIYAEMGRDLRGQVDDPDLKAKLLETADKADTTRTRLKEMYQELADKYIGERNNVMGVTGAEKTITGLAKIFDPVNQIDNNALRVLVRLYNNQEFKYLTDSNKINKEILALTEEIKDKKNAYKLLFKKDSEGRRVHELIDELDPKFGEELRSKSGDDLTEWLKANIDFDAYMKEAKAKIEERLDGLSGPNAKNREEQILAKYDPAHPQFTAQNALVWKHANRTKWESKEFQEVKKSEPLLKLYRIAQYLNETAAETGYIDYNKSRNFIAFFKKGLIDRILTGGHISPIQDFINGLSASDRSYYGVEDPLSGQRRYVLPKYAASDISSEKLDDKGKTYRDYSDIDDDIGRVLVGYAMEVYRYQAFSEITSQVEAIRHIEQSKAHIRTDRWGKPVFKEDGTAAEDPGNQENARIFEDFEQYLIYGNKYPITGTDADTGMARFRNYFNKFINNVTDKAFGKKWLAEEDKPGASSMIKSIEAVNRGVQLQVLGLAPASALANMFGIQIQAASQGGKYYKFRQWFNNEKYLTFQKFRSREEKEELAQLINLFLPFVEDPGREIMKKIGSNKVNGDTITDFLMMFFRGPEHLAQGATFLSLLQNSIVVNGEIKLISEHAKTFFTDVNGKGYQEYRKGRDAKIKELQKESIWETKTLDKDGNLVIPGLDLNNTTEIRKLSLLSKEISKNISGTMGGTSVSRSSMDIFTRSMMVFKNWIPKLTATRFGKFKKINDPADANAYDIGKVRLFWHVFMEHMNFRVSAVKNILETNDEGMVELDKLYRHYKDDYETRTGKKFEMEASEFNDMIIRNLRNQVREMIMLLSMLALMIGTGFLEPPDDPQAKSVFNFTKRGIDQMINELSFYYNPMNWENLLSGSVFPAIGIVNDVSKLVTNFAMETTGIDYTKPHSSAEEVRDNAQPIKYLLKINPGARQFVLYMAAFAPNMAEEMNIQPPQATINRH